MGKFNLGDYLRDNVFNKADFKKFTAGIGTVAGGFVDYAKNMATNMMKMSQNVSSFLATSYFPYIVLGIGGIIVLFKLKII